MESLGRLITAMVTPFDESGEVDLRAGKEVSPGSAQLRE